MGGWNDRCGDRVGIMNFYGRVCVLSVGVFASLHT